MCNVRTWRTRVHMCTSPAVSAHRRMKEKKIKKNYTLNYCGGFFLYIIIVSSAHVTRTRGAPRGFSSANTNDTIHLSVRQISHVQRMSLDLDDVSFYIPILFSLLSALCKHRTTPPFTNVLGTLLVMRVEFSGWSGSPPREGWF